MLKKLIIAGVIFAPFLFSAQDTEVKVSESKVAIIPSVGYAWRLAKMPSGISKDTRDYLKGLKSGVDVGVSAYYLIKGNVGVGLKYSGYFASSNGRITVQDSNGQTVGGFVSTEDQIHFIGAAYMFSNFSSDTKHKLFYDVALGVITYNTTTGNIKGTGSNLGAEINFAYQYAITNNIFIGPKIGMTGGTLSKMKLNGTTVDLGDEKEGLTRLSLSAAATFRF
ncbi:autotransporter domain-containing protein [Chryseobacterium binzhouense]|uniref:autotransporter domain-containing protein n=1 Tax=Chryseobacterium binzhouense TaxID=2593646 RepID=UPI001180D9B8|nr:autotransporter domain-containing protein [Chryseobacterium binzhouense]MXS71441.1 hypothetical protein [Flavobacteriaceae bacterium W22]